ncbi:MAG: hypothetical protein RIS09_530 [Actinomycetota bacterium]|jgi:endonuclease III
MPIDEKTQVKNLVKLAHQARIKSESTFVQSKEWKLASDLENNPHLFLLACMAMRQVKAETAWSIPSHIKEAFGTSSFSKLEKLEESEWRKILKGTGHRYHKQLARNYPLALSKIKTTYKSRADNIWANQPSSYTVMIRLRDFQGIGPKIAAMTLDILVREFNVQFSDYAALDIAPDVHVRRVMQRLGLISRSDSNDMAIFKAREMNPNYPGIFDSLFWRVGRDYCHPRHPECEKCPLNSLCETATNTS